MRIPFKLGKIKNSNSWTDETSERFSELINTINKKLNNKSFSKNLNSLDRSVTLSSENNIAEIGSTSGSTSYNVNVSIDDQDNDKTLFYLILDSTANISLTSTLGMVSNGTSSKNRTLYIIRKLDEDTILIYKELKDIYLPDSPDFETEDFIDWDLPVG